MEKVGDGGVDNISLGGIFDEPAITPSSIRGSPDGTMSRRASIVWVVYFFFLSLSLRFPLPPFPPRSLAQRPCSDCKTLVTCPQLPLVVTHGGETAGGTVTLR